MRITYITFLLCLCANSLLGQEVNSSEIDQLIEDCTTNTHLTRSEDIKALEKVDYLSREINYSKGIVVANISLAALYRDHSPDISSGYISICDSIYEVYPDVFTVDLLIEHNLNKGYNLGFSGDLLSELQYYLIADSISKQNGRDDLQSLTDQYLCGYYYLKEDYTNALAYNRKLITYYKENKEVSVYLLSLQNAGNIYQKMGAADSSIYYIELAIDNGLGEHQNLGFPYILLGDAYLTKGNLEKAQYYVNEMKIALDTSYNFSVDGVLANVLSGELNLKLNELDQAKKDFELALHYADSIDFTAGQNKANYFLIYTHLLDAGNSELITNLKNYVAGVDSVYANKSYKLEKQLLIQYETGKKEIEIEQLKLKNIVNRNTIVTISLVGFILLLVIVFIYRASRTKRKLLERNLEMETLKKGTLNNELNLAIEKIKDHTRIIEEFKKKDFGNDGIETIVEVLNQNYVSENEWAKVILHFDLLNESFTKKLLIKYPNLTIKEVRLMVLVKLGYSNKGIIEINNITENGVKKAKQRLLKKLEIESFRELTVN